MRQCLGGEQLPADPFGDGRRDGVAQAAQSVHPIGNPISASTYSGCGVPPIWSGKVGVWSPVVRSRHDFALMPLKSRAFGDRIFGEQEQPVPSIVRANATRPDAEGCHRVVESLQFLAEAPPRPRGITSDAGRVLSQDKARATCSNNPEKFGSERRVAGSMSPGIAVSLAWVAAANKVNCLKLVTPKRADIAEASDVGPVPAQHTRAERINFHLPPHQQAGALQAQVEAANAGKQAAEGHGASGRSGWSMENDGGVCRFVCPASCSWIASQSR